MDRKKIVLSLLAVAILVGCLAVPVAATGTENFVIMYVAGGDLEDTNPGYPHEGTDNVYKLIENIDPTKTELLVFYGGARNLAGWGDGMSVADYACLKANKAENPNRLGQDATGNPTKNVLGRIDTKMTTGAGLKAAVEYANEYAKKKQISNIPRFIVLWDHGGAYKGYAADYTRSNKSSDYYEMIPLLDIRDALKASDKKFSMIIFDACLMSCIEAAYELRDTGDYLLASEELAQGGFNYQNAFGKVFASTSDPVTIGKAIIKGYISQPTPENYSTLSLIDMSKVNAVASALDTLGLALTQALQDSETVNVLVKTYQDTHSFGVTGENSYGTTSDLSHFVSNIARYGRGSLKDAANAVGSTVNSAVIANEVQRASPNSNGISVAKYLKSDTDFSEYKGVISLSGNGWADYLSSVRNYLENSSNSPVPLSLAIAVFAPQEATARGTSTKTPLVLENRSGTEVVMVDFLLKRDDGTEVILGQDLAEQSMVASDNPYWEYVPSDSYSADYEWDGAWFVLENKDARSFITMNYLDEYTYNGTEYVEYFVDGTMTRNGTTLDSSLVVTVNADAGNVDNVYVESVDSQKPVYVNEWGNGYIKAGDVFTPCIDVYNEATDTITTENGKSYTFSSNPESDFKVVQFDDDKVEWMYEVFTVFDDEKKTFVDENGKPREPAKSPFPVLGILAGLAVAGVFCVLGRRA